MGIPTLRRMERKREGYACGRRIKALAAAPYRSENINIIVRLVNLPWRTIYIPRIRSRICLNEIYHCDQPVIEVVKAHLTIQIGMTVSACGKIRIKHGRNINRASYEKWMDYSCGQPNTTTLISRDLDFFEANWLQIRIQLVEYVQKRPLRSFSHDFLGWPKFLSKFVTNLWLCSLILRLVEASCHTCASSFQPLPLLFTPKVGFLTQYGN